MNLSALQWWRYSTNIWQVAAQKKKVLTIHGLSFKVIPPRRERTNLSSTAAQSSRWKYDFFLLLVVARMMVEDRNSITSNCSPGRQRPREGWDDDDNDDSKMRVRISISEHWLNELRWKLERDNKLDEVKISAQTGREMVINCQGQLIIFFYFCISIFFSFLLVPFFFIIFAICFSRSSVLFLYFICCFRLLLVCRLRDSYKFAMERKGKRRHKKYQK